MATATQELLDRLAQWYGGDSIATDYRLALDYFKVRPQKISEYRTGKRGFAEDRVIAICEDIWPGDEAQQAYWLLRIQADREQSEPVKSVWRRLAEQARAASLVLALGIVGLVPTPPAQAGANFSCLQSMYYARIRRWLARRRCAHPNAQPAQRLPAGCYVCPDCGAVFRRRPAALRAWVTAIIGSALTLGATGCSTMQREVAWQALHAVDVAQTINGPARDDCFIEADRLTRSLIGEKPSTGEALAWGAGVALVHAGVTLGLKRLNAPQWLQIGWQVVTITNTSYSLVNNHREGIRPFGANDCPHG